MDKKPATWGAEVIRVLAPAKREMGGRDFVYFYDLSEAEKFVRANWKQGEELSARVRGIGEVWETVFGIAADGTIFVSPDYHRVASRATRVLGKMFVSV